jgi:opacity protein-like surface antigen
MRKLAAAVSVFALLALAPQTAAAVEDTYDGEWHFSLAPYLWLSAFSGTFHIPGPGGGKTIDVHASAGDILKSLKFGLMAAGEARRGEWSVFTDLIYARLSDDKSTVRSVTGPGGQVEIPVNVAVKGGLKEGIWTLAGAYSLYHEENWGLDAFIGTRYFGATASVEWQFAGPLMLLPQSGRSERGMHMWDAIIGFKGHYAFGGTPWSIPYYADIGTGGSELTWQALAGIDYAFSWGDVSLVYRYLDFRPNGTKVVENLAMHGPALAVKFTF